MVRRVGTAIGRVVAGTGLVLLAILGTPVTAWAAPAEGTARQTSPYGPGQTDGGRMEAPSGSAQQQDDRSQDVQPGANSTGTYDGNAHPAGQDDPANREHQGDGIDVDHGVPARDDPPADDGTGGPTLERDPVADGLGGDPGDLGLRDPCLGLDDARSATGGTDALTEELCGDRDRGGNGSPPGPGSVQPSDPTAGTGNPDPGDALCAGVPEGPARTGRGLGTVSDNPIPWTTAYAEALRDWVRDGKDGERDDSALARTGRAIESAPAWLGVAAVYIVENAVNVVTNPSSIHPIIEHGHEVNEALERADERAHEIGRDDDEDDDEDESGAESTGSDSGASGQTGGSGGGPDGTTEPVPGQEASGNGLAELCQEMRERRRQDPHGHDRRTYLDTDCDDPTTNPREDQESLDADDGAERELSCNRDDEGAATGTDGDCGPTAPPAAGARATSPPPGAPGPGGLGALVPWAGMDDAALVEAARAGDHEAFAGIYDRYADRVHDFATSILRDRQEAADVLQDTFLAAAEHLADLRQPEKLRSWLFAIARHEALARIKRRGRLVPVEELPDVPAPDADHEARPFGEGELTRLVTDAAAGLDDRDRVVLDLHLRQHLTGQELADVIGVTEGHAGVLLHRLKQRFERTVGAFLVARSSAGECAQLDAILAAWDGTFSPLIRKRVARHVESCDACAERKRRLVSPLAALAAVPMVPAPRGVRDRVIERVQLVGHGTARPLTGRGGFPPSAWRRVGRRWPRAGAAAVLAALLAVGGFLITGDDDAERVVATDARGSEAAGSRRDTAVATTTGADGVTVTAGPPPRRSGSGPDAGASGPTAATTPTTAPAPGGGSSQKTASTAPGDTSGPNIGTIGASPASIHEAGTAGCQDTTSTVTVTITDASGTASATLSWSVGATVGSKALSGAGTTWSASIGPFDDGTVAPSTSQAITLTVVAKDAKGNSSSRSSGNALVLHDCTFA